VLGALPLGVELAQLAHCGTDRLFGLAQLVDRFLAVRLRAAKFLLQGLQPALQRVEFGFLEIGLVGSGRQGPGQRQQDEVEFGCSPG
jgi:hypothetical protein